MITQTALWITIIGLGIGSFFFRFVFLGIVGDRPIPAWLMRHLRYTAVAVLPALVAPQVLWPNATGGEPEPARLAAAAATIVVGLIFKNALAAMVAGGATLFLLLALLY